MAGRKPYKPTKKHIETVQKLKEQGATDKDCYNAIGISDYTWKKYKKTFFSCPIKKGNEIRQQTHLEIFEDNLPKQLTGYFVEEVINRVNPTTGVFELYEKKKKWIAPNATLMMFTAVNAQNAINGKIPWQSINKVEQKVEIDNTPKIELRWTEPK